MDDRYQLRPTVRSDVPAMVALERAAFSDPWTARQLEDALDADGAFGMVAEQGGEVIGSVLGRVVADEGEILTLAVAPPLRRLGLGRVLLDAAIAACRIAGAATLWLEVRDSNAAAKAMYRSAGFVAAGVRRSYYRRPTEDAVVLCLRLPPAA